MCIPGGPKFEPLFRDMDKADEDWCVPAHPAGGRAVCRLLAPRAALALLCSRAGWQDMCAYVACFSAGVERLRVHRASEP